MSRRRRALCWLVCLFQLFALVASFQLSNVGHFASDVVQVLTVGHHHDVPDDDEDDPGHECPPGCPNCHHVHPGGASLPQYAESTPSVAPIPRRSPERWLADDDVPPGPQLPSIYRPPRV